MEILLIFVEFVRFAFELSIMLTYMCGRFKESCPVLANHSW